MAINLTGKSDATLVTAATRAGLATSPKSYQTIFEDVSRTYGETMQSVTESWKEIAKLTGDIGLEAVENSIYNIKRDAALEAIPMSDEDGEFYVDKLQDIKQRLNKASSLKERIKINKERDDLYAQVEMFGAERKFIINALASGNIDEQAMGANGMELLNAIAATGTEKKNTKQGNYFAATEDPLTGEIMYTLMKDPSILIDKEPKDAPVIGPRKSSQKVLGADGKPIVIRAGDIEKSIILKNPQLPIDLTKVLNNVEKTASQIGGGYTDYEKNKVRKQFVPFVETSSGLKQSLRANFGGLENSFYDELTNPGKDGSMLSVDIFNALKSALGTTADGQIDGEGILKGVEDKDGKKGLSKDELSNGYMFMSGAIMNLADEDATREIFLNWAESKASAAWEYGSRKYKSRNPSNNNLGSNIIDLFNERASLIPMNQFQSAVKQSDGDYVIVKNSDVSRDHSKLKTYSAEEIIKSLGGTVDTSKQTPPPSDLNREKISMLFGPGSEEEPAVERLKEMFPNLKISSPISIFSEKIKVNGKTFNLRKPNDPEQGIDALLEHINKINVNNEFAQ